MSAATPIDLWPTDETITVDMAGVYKLELVRESQGWKAYVFSNHAGGLLLGSQLACETPQRAVSDALEIMRAKVAASQAKYAAAEAEFGRFFALAAA